MTKKSFIFFSLLTLLFLLPGICLAGQEKIIFSYDVLSSVEYQKSASQWQITQNSDSGLYKKDDGMMLKNDGGAYLIYPFVFSYHDYDQLKIIFYSDQPATILLVPDVTTIGSNSFELRKKVSAQESYQTIDFSLRHPFFKNKVQDIGLNFYTVLPSNLVIKEIVLVKLDFSEVILQVFKDYFLVAPYSAFTVNLFPTPRIFGHDALIYFLPLILLLAWLFFKSCRFRKIAGIILLLIWILIDCRMSYEFFVQGFDDYRNFVTPPQAEKKLRTYDDFYQFAGWLKDNLSKEYSEINFYGSGSVHLPRLLQYLAYPMLINNEENIGPVYVTYNRHDIVYNEAEKRLYQGDKPLSEVGELIANYNKDSFIFVEK